MDRPTTSSGRSSSRRASSLTSCTRSSSSSRKQPFTDGVQHRGVVLVHPGDLGLAHAVGLPLQPSADQPGAGQADGQHRGGTDRDRHQGRGQLALDPVHRDPDRHQRHDPAVVGHRHHRPHRRTERARVLLGEVPPLGCAAEVADELLAQLLRVGVGVAGPVQRHHHDEVDVGVGPHLLGVRLQAGARVRLAQTVADRRGVGHREGDRERLVAGGGAGVPPGVVRREAERHEDQDERPRGPGGRASAGRPSPRTCACRALCPTAGPDALRSTVRELNEQNSDRRHMRPDDGGTDPGASPGADQEEP